MFNWIPTFKETEENETAWRVIAIGAACGILALVTVATMLANQVLGSVLSSDDHTAVELTDIVFIDTPSCFISVEERQSGNFELNLDPKGDADCADVGCAVPMNVPAATVCNVEMGPAAETANSEPAEQAEEERPYVEITGDGDNTINIVTGDHADGEASSSTDEQHTENRELPSPEVENSEDLGGIGPRQDDFESDEEGVRFNVDGIPILEQCGDGAVYMLFYELGIEIEFIVENMLHHAYLDFPDDLAATDGEYWSGQIVNAGAPSVHGLHVIDVTQFYDADHTISSTCQVEVWIGAAGWFDQGNSQYWGDIIREFNLATIPRLPSA